jgi:glycosyltransferase involved in cell wall biosynthesis
MTMHPQVQDEPLGLGIFVDQRLEAGGGYQQSLTAALLASKLSPQLCRCVGFSPHQQTVDVLTGIGLPAFRIKLGPLRRAGLALRSRVMYPSAVRLMRRLIGANSLERTLEAHKIDLVYFTSPTPHAQHLERLNYVYTIWDLCHRDEPEFPEVRYDREFERRDRLYHAVLPKAAAVLVDSEEGAGKVARRYAVDIERIHVMRFSPAMGSRTTEQAYNDQFVDIKLRFGLEHDYIFYPAQFWAHKNHAFILEALHALEVQHSVRLAAVFAGGDIGGNQAHVSERAKSLGLDGRVKFAGFVPSQMLPYLYKQSLALVMPTYFGPTNIPPLEALMFDTPVVYPQALAQSSGLQATVLTMDVDDTQSLVDRLLSLVRSPGAAQATERQERVRATLTALDDDSVRLANLSSVVSRFKRKRRCWAPGS